MKTPIVALMWHGDRHTRNTVTLDGHRLGPTADAMREVGLDPRPAVYNDDFADEVREQLLKVDAVQVWVNPITEDGRTRAKLDNMLREVADSGVLVKSHPDTIQKMGTKDVLFKTREMAWGSDVQRYESIDDMLARLPKSLQTGPRVLKQFRGHSGQGIWKLTPTADEARILARHAPRGSQEEELPLAQWIDNCFAYFETGPMYDQPFNPRIEEGTIRCYFVRDRIEGFGHQELNALVPGTDAGPRLYFPPDRPDFQDIKHQAENEWVPQLMTTVGVSLAELPMLWDIDLMFADDGYMLCEINVSSVYPYPESAMRPLANAFRVALASR